MSNISVVICTFTEERWKDLEACVKSLRIQTVPPREIIIIIDHNLSLFQRARSELIGEYVIMNKRSPGLSGARNTGIEAAQGEIIAFLDDDAVAEPDWLEKLQNGYSCEGVIGVGGAIEPIWEADRPRWFPVEFDWVVGCTYRGLPEVKAFVRNLIGANMSFKSEVCKNGAGFSSNIGQIGKSMIRCDDTEFCIRVSQNLPWTRFLYEPGALVHHRVPASRTKWRYFCARCFTEGLAKALVTQYVGQKDALSTESSYVYHTLPKGIRRGLIEGICKGDLYGFSRSFAILAGFMITTYGYIAGRLLEWIRHF